MKKSLTVLAVTLLVIFSGILSPTYGQWPKYVIDDDIWGAVNVDVADLDGDTKLDLVVAEWGGKKLLWYQNNFPYWIKHTIDEGGVTFAWTADVDGNGTLDIVANLYTERKMVWYENNHPTWTQHIIDTTTDHADFMIVADIDGDDTLDVITTPDYRYTGDVVWYENNHPVWIEHIIEPDIYGTPSLSVADIDGDGLLDVSATKSAEDKVVWYRNENKGLSWTKFPIGDNLNMAWGIESGDINGDGSIDIAVATGGPYNSGSDVVWYENNHPTWTKHVLDTNLTRAVWPHVADVNSDGTMDVLASGYDADAVVWYENNHPTWTKNIIDANLAGPRLFILEDLDGDQINDLIVAGKNSVAWYKNPYTTAAFGQSLDVYPKFIHPNGDTLLINAHLSNPEDLPLTVYAKIHGDENSFQDSVELFDDGLHGDGEASDNIWGEKWLSSLQEDMYTVDLSINDLSSGINSLELFGSRFTTAGPIVIDTFSVFQVNDSLVAIDDLKLLNLGTQKTISAVSAELKTTDICVTRIQISTSPFGSIAPGASRTAFTTYGYISSTCNEGLVFELEISTDGVVYWTDSLIVDLVTGIEDESPTLPNEFSLVQNYPNPFNPSTTIKYSLPAFSELAYSEPARQAGELITLKVYDVLGRQVATLVNEHQRSGNYEVKWDANNQPSGIYFYKLTAGTYSDTKKMLLIK